jgi:dTDP-glucose 4,6-dehydratase/UDP-glucose 4,6-dehydratase
MYPNVRNIKDAVRDCLYSYKEYLQNHPRRINLLVTGGCGFIGSNFINYIFDKQKYNIINLDAMYYCASENNVYEYIRKSDFYHMIKGNINDKDLVYKLLWNYNITQVIHFAAQSHVDNSFSVPLQYTYDNVQGTHTLLEEVRKYGKVERFIHVSTDEVYGESMLLAEEAHKTEQSVLCPTNPYAASKAGAELIAQSYNHSFKMPIIITRGNNVYGENQYPEKVIPRFIKLLKENKKVTIQGDGSVVRAFLHAHDTARAFETILEKGVIGEIYNIGCDEGMEYSILNVAQMLIKKIKNTENYNEWIEYIADRPFNDKRYYISNQKLKDLGWDIKVKFEEGIEKLV